MSKPFKKPNTDHEYRQWIKGYFEKKRTGLIIGVDKEYLTRLSKAGYVYMHKLIAAGRTKADRQKLSKELDIPYDILYRIIQCCDMAQIVGLSGKVLYYVYELGYRTIDEYKNADAAKINQEALDYLSSIGKRPIIPACSRPGNWVDDAKKIESLIEQD